MPPQEFDVLYIPPSIFTAGNLDNYEYKIDIENTR